LDVPKEIRSFACFLFLLSTLSFRLSERRQQCGVTSLQSAFVFIPVLILTSLGGSGVSRGWFSIDRPFLRKRGA
jgi:hypothetical protein